MGVVTTVHSLKGNIQDALDYVLDESKTEQCITECSNCASPLLAGKKWKSMYPQEIKADEIVIILTISVIPSDACFPKDKLFSVF